MYKSIFNTVSAAGQSLLPPAGLSHVAMPALREAPELRPMQEGDADAVLGLIRKTMNASEAEYARQTLDFHFSCKTHDIADGRSYYVLEDNPAISGIVGLHRYCWDPPENVWLAWFAVDPVLQGQGLGKRLLKFAVDLARRQGYEKIFIETYSTPEFARARRFYRSQGFQKAGSVRSYLPNGGDMVVFSKELIPPV
ncbi:GNAT family N-acetyltransferase [Candidatus Sumerlaeota bacterium]